MNILTKNGQVNHIDAFYSDYSKRLKICSENILKYIKKYLPENI